MHFTFSSKLHTLMNRDNPSTISLSFQTLIFTSFPSLYKKYFSFDTFDFWYLQCFSLTYFRLLWNHFLIWKCVLNWIHYICQECFPPINLKLLPWVLVVCYVQEFEILLNCCENFICFFKMFDEKFEFSHSYHLKTSSL